MKQQIQALLFAAGAAFLSTGCYASAGTTGVAYAEVYEAPVVIDVATYPHSYYEGRTVYYYQDRWYYQDGGRWAYYREEPPTLYRQRAYVQRAPAARQERYAAPAVREHERYYAPPAAREHNEYGHQERARPARKYVAPAPAVQPKPGVRRGPHHVKPH